MSPTFGRPASPRIRRELMLPILAFRIQELAHGGLTPETVETQAHPDQLVRFHRPEVFVTGPTTGHGLTLHCGGSAFGIPRIWEDMVVCYVVGKLETVDASTFRRFLVHFAFNVLPGLLAKKESLPGSYGTPTAFGKFLA